MIGAAQGVSVPELIEVGGQFLIPLLVGLLTKSSTPAKYKWFAMAVLTGLNASLVGMSQQSDPAAMLVTAAFGVIVSLGVKKGIFDPTGVTDWAQSVLVKDKSATAAPVGPPDDEDAGGATDLPSEESVPAACPVRHKEGSRASVLCKGNCSKK